jgi:hypothetical protein
MVAKERKLNDYECLLATSTCNVSLLATIPSSFSRQRIQSAWQKCVESYELLQVRLVVRDETDLGVLGNLRYHAVPIEDESVHSSMLCQVVEDGNPPTKLKFCRFELLKTFGSHAVNIEKGSYVLKAWLSPSRSNSSEKELFVILSLTHSLSDGPGTLQLAHRLLEILMNVNHAAPQPQPLIDLQARLLGADYGASFPRKDDAYRDLVPFQRSLAEQRPENTPILPPESLQLLPRQENPENLRSLNGFIDAVHVELDSSDTQRLIRACRAVDATVQGAISAAAVVARLKTLRAIGKMSFDSGNVIECAIQVPVNARNFAKEGGLEETCLCGSAGVVHSVNVDITQIFKDINIENTDGDSSGSEDKYISDMNRYLLSLTKECTDKLKIAIQEKQPLEWLRRIMNDPTGMPPYSIMASSVGVSPVQATYSCNDETIRVEECLFFGSSLKASKEAQATMIHVATFDGRMQIMMNYTRPGIQYKPFMTLLAKETEQTLRGICWSQK